MKNSQSLLLLLIELISKHPSLNNTYTLTRFFAKSSVLPDKLYAALNDLVVGEYATVKEVKITGEYYEITVKGSALLATYDVFEVLQSFANEIDPSGFTANIIFLIENKGNLVEMVDSYLLSDGKLIASINSGFGKLADGTILENAQNKKWRIKQLHQVWGSIETYEIIQRAENENTFQYLLEGIEHENKPEKGTRLKIVVNNV